MPPSVPALGGLLVFLLLLKSGHAVVLDHLVKPPQSLTEWLTVEQAWPVVWGQWAVAVWAVFCLRHIRIGKGWHWTIWAPAGWLIWQFISAAGSVSPKLTAVTLQHFCCCVACFYLGCWVLARCRNLNLFALGLIAGLFALLVIGMDQHFWQFKATRELMQNIVSGGWKEIAASELADMEQSGMILKTASGYSIAPGFAKRMASNRIFATFGGYANVFAGALLLLVPIVTISLCQWMARHGALLSRLTVGTFIASSSVCLYWTGSKAAMLIAVALGLWMAFTASISKPFRVGILMGLVSLVAIFVVPTLLKYNSTGAKSAIARVSYWKSAIATFQEHPVLGSGPGTFGVMYAKNKNPDDEMAKLTHNDFLQQASDSGAIGLCLYLAAVFGVLRSCVSRIRVFSQPKDIAWAISLGVLAWFTHGLVEFALYVPSAGITTWLLAGIIVGFGNHVDTKSVIG